MKRFFWIPKPILAVFYYPLLVVAVYKITISAANNFWQFLIVVAVVIFIFNFAPYQLLNFFKYLFKTDTKKSLFSVKKLIRFISIVFLLLIIFLFFIMEEDNSDLVYECADEKYSEYVKETQDEIDTFLGMRQKFKNEDVDYAMGLMLCEEEYKMYKDEFIKKYKRNFK